MVKLCCAVIGEESVIVVDIGDQQLVGDLKERIKRRAGYGFPSHRLTLYLAKQNGVANGAWMTAAHPDYTSLLRGDASAEATYLTTEMLLDPTWKTHNYFDRNTPRKKVIHVLVQLPDDRSTRNNATAEGFSLLGCEVARTTGSSLGLAFSYLSQLLPKTVSESKKKQ